MSDLRYAGVHWPENAGGEHPSVEDILALPGISRGCTLICSPSARYWYRQARGASPLVVWRAIPRQGRLPAQLNWIGKRIADECLNLWDEQPHGGVEHFTPLNELQFLKEAGEEFRSYAETASKLSNVRIALRQRFQALGHTVRLMFPAWVPQDDLDRLAEWEDEARQWNTIGLHCYGDAEMMQARYLAYRAAFPNHPIFVGEWNSNHGGHDERASLEMWRDVAHADPLFLGAAYYIWETNNAGERDLSIWGNPARLALFQNPPGAEEPPMSNREQYEPVARAAAERHGLDQEIFVRQITQESGWNPAALSPAGAAGIAQIVPRFHPGVNVWDPEASLEYAAGLMRDHLAYWRAQGASHPTDYARGLASYNAGRQATIDGLAGRKPGWPFNETVRYVAAILQVPAGEAAQLLTAQPAAGPEPIKLSEVLARGRARIGDPYVWDGEQPGGFDCSGFIRYCYRGRLTSFTDAILGETTRIEQPAPGDIVLYEYTDPSQPGVRFPHGGLYLDDGRALDARYPDGVGERAQLPRTQARRYYRRAPNVEVDTLAPPPPPPPVDDLAALRAENARLRTALGYLTVDVADALAKEVEAIKASLGALEAAISTQRSHKP